MSYCRVQELCESRGGRPGISVLKSLMVSTVDVKQHWTVLRHWSQFVPNNYVNRHPRTWSSTSSSSCCTALADRHAVLYIGHVEHLHLDIAVHRSAYGTAILPSDFNGEALWWDSLKRSKRKRKSCICFSYADVDLSSRVWPHPSHHSRPEQSHCSRLPWFSIYSAIFWLWIRHNLDPITFFISS